MAGIDLNNGILCLSGDANIRCIADIHATLLTVFQKQDVIILDLAGITDVDLTFVQLIEAARHSSAGNGRHFSLMSGVGGALLDILQRGGFLASAGDACFWLHTTEIQ